MSDRLIKVNDQLQVDEEHGIVVGFGIVSMIDGQPYYDLNIDTDGVHKGQAVPEHITEDAVIASLVDASEVGILPGNEMHAGPDTGHYVGLFPLTTDIAKALGITTSRTGLLVAYKPAPDVLAKFKDGTYTGFSIEGARIKHEELPDA